MPFRTVRLSDPSFESNNLRFMTIKSPHLKGRGDICVYVPPDSQSDALPICILLHGVYGSCWSWAMQGGAHRTAQRMMIDACSIRPMILAMPSDGLWGDGSGYLPHNGQDFARWIVEDVVDAVRGYIPEAKLSRKLFITGLSMGGFGALRLGATYPARFDAVSAHSAITSLRQMPDIFVEENYEALQQANKIDENVFLSLKRNQGQLPPFRFDCGKDDVLIAQNRRLHQQLEEAGIAHQYEEFEGAHEWSYWTEHLAESLVFFDRHG